MELGKVADELEWRLKGELPGSKAHEKMAPSDRIHGIYPSIPNEKTIPGAVLILLYMKEGHLFTVLIQRPSYPGVHSDQVSFPGGKSERGDETLIDTAKREAEEEIGVLFHAINIRGTLSSVFIPVSNIMVTPFVGSISSPPVFKPNQQEVKFIIEAKISDLANICPVKMKKIKVRGQEIRVPFYELGDIHIWGATAMIISEFIEIYNSIEF